MVQGMINWDLLVLAQEAVAANAVPWFRTPWGALLILLAVIFAAYFAARTLANSLRLAEYHTRLSVMIGAVTLGILVLLMGWPPRLGVDLRGGINIIGQLNLEMLKDHSNSGAVTVTASDIIPRLLRRVDPGGTRDVQIRPVGNDRIEVTIPDVDDQEADEIWSRLVKTGLLQFRIVCDAQFHSRIMDLARNAALEGNIGRNVYETNSRGETALVARWYNLAREEQEGQTRISPDAPFKDVPRRSALVRDRQTGRIIDMGLFSDPGNKRAGAEFAAWLKQQGVRTPQILVLEPTRELLNVEGKHLTNVRPEIDEYAVPCVSFSLTPEGSRRMYQLTSEFKPREGSKFQLGIILDDALHTAPEILEPISSQGRITGRFTQREVDDLKRNLESGRLEVALHKDPISRTYQASTLGIELREKGFYAIGISLVVVLLFMLFYYRLFCGSVASLVLLANMVLVLAWVIAIRQPLSLTGLAGLVLTVGMAVDANVLIFERIREELIKGTSLRMAIRNGFDRATTTIIDANVTTLITAIVLYGFGTEQIKGFSITLILGILMGMFTAVYCARTVFEIAERKKWITRLSMMQIVTGKKFDFLGKRRVAFAASGLLIIVGMVSMFSLGGELFDIDLRGGSTARVVFKDEVTADNVRTALAGINLKHNDRNVDFLVTKLEDKDHPNRVFKIDSSLPTYEEGQGERWKQLDEVLEEVFAGKLVTREVQVGERTIEKLEGREWRPFSWHAPNREGRIDWASRLDAGTALVGLLMIQDETPPSGQTEEKQEPAPPATPPAGRYRTTVPLKFSTPVSGQSIITMLVEAGSRVDVEIEEESVTLASAEVPPDESLTATAARNWDITLETTRPEDAAKILESWQSRFNGSTYFPMISGVGGQVAKGAQWQALAAVVASLICIVIYIWVRFQSLAYSLAAVLALIHDVLVVLGAIAISHYLAGALGFLLIVNFKISLTVMAAILTVIGYSLNDTIVVFDRVRETRGKRLELTSDMINSSLSQTLSRTLLTSFTTFVVVFILYIWGGDTIHGFAFALVVGIVVGTYSSIFVASPFLLWLMNRFQLHEPVEGQPA